MLGGHTLRSLRIGGILSHSFPDLHYARLQKVREHGWKDNGRKEKNGEEKRTMSHEG